MDHVEETQQPKGRGAPDVVHDAMHHPLQVLNASLDGVLVLIMGLGLFVLNKVHTEQILHLEGCLRFRVIGLKTLHCSIVTDEVLQCCGHFGLRGHRVTSKQLRVQTPVDLDETASAMPRSPVVVSGNVRNKSISRVPFREAAYISGGETGSKMLAHWDTLVCLIMLCSFFKGVTDAFLPHPAEIRQESIKVRKATTKRLRHKK